MAGSLARTHFPGLLLAVHPAGDFKADARLWIPAQKEGLSTSWHLCLFFHAPCPPPLGKTWAESKLQLLL